MKEIGIYILLCVLISTDARQRKGTKPVDEQQWEEEINRLANVTKELSMLPIEEESPGFRARITQTALDYVTTLAIDILMSQIQYIEIPNIKERVATSDVTIKNVKIIRFDRPSSRITPIQGYGISWKIWDLNVRVTAQYEAVMSFGIFGSVTKSGTVSVRTKDMSFTIELLIGRDPITLKPTTITPNCFSGGDLIITFKGGWADMLNVGSSVFANTIRGVIASQICSAIQTQIDQNLNSEMGTIPTNETVAGIFDFNFGMTEYPTFTEDYLETSHKGVAYYQGQRVEPPFDPPVIPEFTNHTNKMVYLYLSDYVLNSVLYAGYLSGLLRYYISNDMLPPDVKEVLSSSCEFPAICLGTIFPGLPEKHPSGSVEIEVYAVNCPYIQFYDGHGIIVTASGQADFFVKEQEIVSPIFSINFTVIIDIALKVNGSLVSFEVKSLCPKVDILSSSIGDVGTGFFYETIIRVVSQALVLPKLAELGSKGFVLPSSVDIKLSEPEIMQIVQDGIFVVATDISVNIPKDLNLIALLSNSNTTNTSSETTESTDVINPGEDSGENSDSADPSDTEVVVEIEVPETREEEVRVLIKEGSTVEEEILIELPSEEILLAPSTSPTSATLTTTSTQRRRKRKDGERKRHRNRHRHRVTQVGDDVTTAAKQTSLTTTEATMTTTLSRRQRRRNERKRLAEEGRSERRKKKNRKHRKSSPSAMNSTTTPDYTSV